jgi:catechol 2,3-dioxygenase-like lactoylglutathione lyase family enzyme
MLTGIDHIVVVTPDLEQAVAGYRELGFTVVPGGRHAAGTHNALIALADGAYIELIAFLDVEGRESHRWWRPLQRGGGLVDFCAATDDFDADAEAFRRAGIEMVGPQRQSRTRPDGYELRWTLATPAERFRGLVPFLITDDTARRERVPAATRHPNGATSLGGLTVAVPDLAEAVRWYAALLGQTGAEWRDDDLGAAGRRFRLGSHAVDLAIPASLGRPLGAVLRERGGGPYAVTLTGAFPGPRRLDERRAQGARFRFQ